jgi:hypothetical protein
MDMKQAIEDAVGAAMKAIQSAENAGRNSAIHTRTGALDRTGCRVVALWLGCMEAGSRGGRPEFFSRLGFT